MSDARRNILERLRSTPAKRDATCEALFPSRKRGPQPAYGEDLQTRFIHKLEAAAATVSRLQSRAEVPAAVHAFLQSQNVPARLACAPDPWFDDLPWADHGLDMERRVPTAHDVAGLSLAFCGIAETGSLVLLSGPQTPTTLNFLPDYYLCVVRADRLVAYLEDAWDLIRAECGAMPRAVNLITGPSRTADVEQTIQLGAHGPRRVHVLFVDG